MERRVLGATGIQVPVVGLGTHRVFNVKGDAGQARCDVVVEAGLAAGANLFDASPMYGEAERVLADALGERRDEAFVATKVWARTRDIGETQVEKALAQFGSVDLYQVQNLLAFDDHLPFLQRQREAGRVAAIGVTHYLESAAGELLQLMRDRRVDAIQVPYHPGERWVEREILPEAERLGIGVIAMTPLACGRLVDRDPGTDKLAPLDAFGVQTWPQALIKWILSDQRIDAVIPGTSSPDHLRENAAAGDPPWFTGDERHYVRRLAGES